MSAPDGAIRAEAQRRLDAEREESERAAAVARDEACRRLVIEHIREHFGRVFAVLRDDTAFTSLMVAAGLSATMKELRVNPSGSTTEVTTVRAPSVMSVSCNAEWLALGCAGVVGQTLANWTRAAEVLRSGLRASEIQISEPRGGLFKIDVKP